MSFNKPLIILALITIVSFIVNAGPAPNLRTCPSFLAQSFLTQNNDCNSSYVDPDLDKFFKSLYRATKFNLNRPMLDVGAGYGGGTYELIKLGAKNIYANDLDKNNLACMRAHINKYANNNKAKITYLLGDISSDAVAKKLPNDKFSFVFAKNIIQLGY